MVIDLESLYLVGLIMFFLLCFIRFIKTSKKMSNIEKMEKEYDLERKYRLYKESGHKIKALIYKWKIKRFRRKYCEKN